jgi:hypothetical protein
MRRNRGARDTSQGQGSCFLFAAETSTPRAPVDDVGGMRSMVLENTRSAGILGDGHRARAIGAPPAN